MNKDTNAGIKDDLNSADTNLEAQVIAAIDVIRPAIQSDGGDITFVNIDENNVVHVKLVGACGGCSTSTSALRSGIKWIVMDKVPTIAGVIDDSVIDPDAQVTGQCIH